MALEATTGWRFVVEELQRVGAEVHLAEPAEAAALKGKKKRAKTDWADARHLRELLLIGRLPESWIPPTHNLDLRARVRMRHLLSHQRTEWQQRIHSVLYHHGVAQQRNLLTAQKREWLAGLALPAAAREQITIALSVIDTLDLKLVPFDQELRAHAKKQPGCCALIDQIYGVGALTAITILAELGDPHRPSRRSAREARILHLRRAPIRNLPARAQRAWKPDSRTDRLSRAPAVGATTGAPAHHTPAPSQCDLSIPELALEVGYSP